MKKIKPFLQKIRIQIGKWILDKQLSDNTVPHNIQKILFLRQDGKIGDYIVSSFVFRELKRCNPNIHIGVICTKAQKELLESNPYIDELYFVRCKNIIDYIKCGLNIRKQKYDAVVDPTVFIRNRDLLLLRLIHARYYVGYEKQHYKLFNLNISGSHHFSELYKLSLEKLGLTIENTQYDVPSNPYSQKCIEKFLQDNKLKDYICVNFFGASRIKKVSTDNMKKYLSYLTHETNSPIILLSYPAVMETLKELASGYQNVFVHDTQTIFDTIELIRHCRLIISTDTSTIHIASGFHKKIIAMYQDNKEAFANWHPNNQTETHILFYQNNINELSPEQIPKEWLSS